MTVFPPITKLDSQWSYDKSVSEVNFSCSTENGFDEMFFLMTDIGDLDQVLNLVSLADIYCDH